MTNKNDNRINLKNDRKMVLPKRKTSEAKKEKLFFRTTVNVPLEARVVLLEIDKKYIDLTGRGILDRDKWYVGVRLLNKMLDYANASEVNKNTDLFAYLNMLIEEEFDT